MNTLESMRVALGALRANKLRSGLTMLGIIIGVAAIVCVESVGAGARAEVSEKIRTLGANSAVGNAWSAEIRRSQARNRGDGHTDRR